MKYADAMPIAEALVADLSCACLRGPEIKGSLSRQKEEVGDIELVAIPKYEETGQASLFDVPPELRNLLHCQISDLGEDRILPIKSGNVRRDGGWWRHGQRLPPGEERDDKWRDKGVSDARMFKLWLPRKGIMVDLFMPTPETWGAIATIRTGSAEFSQRLVTSWVKKSRGGHVHKGRIHLPWQIGEPVAARTSSNVPLGPALDTPEERDFFAALGVDWVEPENRR